jgi:hypothetical protein
MSVETCGLAAQFKRLLRLPLGSTREHQKLYILARRLFKPGALDGDDEPRSHLGRK